MEANPDQRLQYPEEELLLEIRKVSPFLYGSHFSLKTYKIL